MNATTQMSLKNHFLIAMPSLDSDSFAHTVTYICEHNEEGAMGLVINRPTELHLKEILGELGLKATDTPMDSQAIFAGGPVQPQMGFILHQDARTWDSTLRVSDDIHLTTSKDILKSIADGEGPGDCLIALGYSGWSPGQLEQELANNCWLTAPARSEIIFKTPAEQRLAAAASLLGIKLDQLSNTVGHA